MMNLNAMKKVELINLINAQNKVIDDLTTENDTLRKALMDVKAATNAFIGAMNDVYKVNTVKTATTTVKKTVDKPQVAAEVTAEVKNDTRKDAPKPEPTQEPTPEPTTKPRTYSEGIEAYKIKKYGSIEVADRVDRMLPKAKTEIYNEAKRTGKYIPRNMYKAALYEKAFEMVKAEMEKEKAAKEKVANATKGAKATAKRNTKGAKATTKGTKTTTKGAAATTKKTA